jgi:hypothetical protein
VADIAASVDINASVRAVFDFVVAEWQGTLAFWPQGIRKWRPTPNRPLGDGFRVRYVAMMLGLAIPVEMEISDFMPDRGWTAKSVSGPLVEGRWQFAPQGAGTRFSYRLRYRMPPPGVGPLLDRWFLAPAWERAILAALANLKRLVETQPR